MLQVGPMASDRTADLGKLLDSDRLRQPRGFEAAVARVVVEPAGLDELSEVVRKCERDRITIAPIGACRTLRHLRPNPVDAAISMARMAQVISYEPDDMTVVVGAGITLGTLDATLGRHGQHLPVDPAFPEQDRKSTRLNSSHHTTSRMPSSA